MPPMPVQPVPPSMDADHPDFYIPEVVKGFLPFFHRQVVEKVSAAYLCTARPAAVCVWPARSLVHQLLALVYTHTHTLTHTHTFPHIHTHTCSHTHTHTFPPHTLTRTCTLTHTHTHTH